MAPTNWARSDLESRVFSILFEENADDNQRLDDSDVFIALELAEQAFARDTRCYRRTATLLAVDEQALYVQPEDMFHVQDVVWDDETTPLKEYKEGRMRRNDSSFRSYDAGSPTYWIRETPMTFRLSQAGEVDDDDTVDITLYGYIVPLSIGGSISTIARSAADVVTVTTAAAHNLRVGDSVTVSGCTTDGLNNAYTVASVTSSVIFTASDEGDTENDSDGYVYYTDGKLPMLADADVPSIPLFYRPALAYYAAWWLADNHLVPSEVARAAGMAAYLRYERMVARFCEEGA